MNGTYAYIYFCAAEITTVDVSGTRKYYLYWQIPFCLNERSKCWSILIMIFDLKQLQNTYRSSSMLATAESISTARRIFTQVLVGSCGRSAGWATE